jgi:hypothetical protein
LNTNTLCGILRDYIKQNAAYDVTYSINHDWKNNYDELTDRMEKTESENSKLKQLLTASLVEQQKQKNTHEKYKLFSSDKISGLKTQNRQIKKIILSDTSDGTEDGSDSDDSAAPDPKPIEIIKGVSDSAIMQNWENLKHHLIHHNMSLSKFLTKLEVPARTREQYFQSWINTRYTRNHIAHPEPQKLDNEEFLRLLSQI